MARSKKVKVKALSKKDLVHVLSSSSFPACCHSSWEPGLHLITKPRIWRQLQFYKSDCHLTLETRPYRDQSVSLTFSFTEKRLVNIKMIFLYYISLTVYNHNTFICFTLFRYFCLSCSLLNLIYYDTFRVTNISTCKKHGEKRHFGAGDYVMAGVFVTLIILNTLGTWHDFIQDDTPGTNLKQVLKVR